MTQKEKQLLLQDLCARVPYHPKGHVVNACNGAQCDEWLTCATFTMFTSVTINCRLYLRPMSSMTEEERKEYKAFHCVAYEHTHFYPQFCTVKNELNMFDWLNKNHFDYRGLIPMGLALEVPEGMYNN